MCPHAGFRWGGARWWEDSRGSGGLSGGGSGERLCSAGLFCVFPFSVSLLFLFPLFAVLLNCPYPDPPVSACCFPFFSAPWRGEGRPHGAFVAGRSQTITLVCPLTSAAFSPPAFMSVAAIDSVQASSIIQHVIKDPKVLTALCFPVKLYLPCELHFDC